MGNADLRTISSIQSIKYSDIAGHTVAVDAQNWLYKYVTTTTKFTNTREYTRDDGTKLPNLIGATQGMKRFVEHNITPIFVFDGTAHDLKHEEIQARKQARQTAKQHAQQTTNPIEKAKYQSHSQTLTTDILSTTKTLFDTFNATYFTAPQNAEAQASFLVTEDTARYVISDDYDTLLFGSPYTIRNFTSSTRPLELLDLVKTKQNHTLTQQQLVTLALLCGTDYNEGIHGIGPKTALKHIHEYDTLQTILTETNNTMNNAQTLQDLFTEPNITTDYPQPTPLDPDLHQLKDVLHEHNITTDSLKSTFKTITQSSKQPSLHNWS